jgi:hypothetical protein
VGQRRPPPGPDAAPDGVDATARVSRSARWRRKRKKAVPTPTA